MIKFETLNRGFYSYHYKVFDDDEFIGYASLAMVGGKCAHNPHPDVTLKANEFDSWNDMLVWLKFRCY